MDIEFGKEALKSGSNYVSQKLKLSFLRQYFNIDNIYIYKKIKMMLFPYFLNWEDDFVNRADLYIPVMCYFTYILVNGMYYGLQNTFTPEKVGLLFSRLIFFEFVFVLLVKSFTYYLNVNLKILDVLSYSGYKYFIVLIMQLIPKSRILAFLSKSYFYVSFFFFLSRSLKNSLISNFSSQRNVKIYFIFSFVFMQIVCIFFLA